MKDIMSELVIWDWKKTVSSKLQKNNDDECFNKKIRKYVNKRSKKKIEAMQEKFMYLLGA